MKRKILVNALAGSVAVAVLFASTLIAAPPLHWDYLKKKPKGFIPCGRLSKEGISKLQMSGALRKAGQAGLMTPRTNKVLALRVQFSDRPALAISKSATEAFFASLQNYYLENSYGRLTIETTVSDQVYSLGAVGNYNQENYATLRRLLYDTINVADSYYDFSQYDHVMIYHQGRGEEESGDSDDLWSLFATLSFTVDGKTFDGFTCVPSEALVGSPLAVICHEYGHQLGLPDLYDTTVFGGDSTCGAWSLMDYPYGMDQRGDHPPHLDPWCKDQLGFVDLASRSVNGAVPLATLNDIETSQTEGFYKVPISMASSSEYFIFEYRHYDSARMQFDASLPGSGILVWHIDDAINKDATRQSNNDINSGVPHYGVDLVRANRGTSYPSYPPGDATDAFPAGNEIFASPMSNTFSGEPTDIVLSSITISGNSVTAAISKIAATPALGIAKVISYPNPAGPSYPHPRSGVIATIVLNVSRPARERSLTIYTLSGEKVRGVDSDKISFKLGATTDRKWIYEFDWDGKNDNGDNVASGVYFYRYKADDEIKTGKLAIVR